MRATDNFFDRKREWSRLKDEILGTYLKPYLTKISKKGLPVVLVDCFAGKGRFDDGEPGSPQLICEAIDDIRSTRPGVDVRGLFIEKKYYRELTANISSFERCEVLPGSFEDCERSLAEFVPQDANLFLFVDPYGIKSLELDRFGRILKLRLSSVEMLLNFNTFGFLREGCRTLKIERFEAEASSDVYEHDSSGPSMSQRLDDIAGGPYWQDILRDYNAGRTDMRSAEERFAAEYVNRLRELFSFVAGIPVKYKREHLPKYRLIHATQSPHGLILMADNMSRTWRRFVNRDRGGQTALFDDIDYPDEFTGREDSLEQTILDLTESRVSLRTLLAELFAVYGIAFSESDLKKTIRSMEVAGELKVSRYPPTTGKGRITKSMNYREYGIHVEGV